MFCHLLTCMGDSENRGKKSNLGLLVVGVQSVLSPSHSQMNIAPCLLFLSTPGLLLTIVPRLG